MHDIRCKFAYAAPVLHVADLRRSVAYYRDRLGFGVELEYEGFYASVIRDGCRIHLSCATPTPRDQAAFEALERLDVCCGVEDAGALAEELASGGAAVTVPLRSMRYGREIYVRDPDGYILGFIQANATA